MTQQKKTTKNPDVPQHFKDAAAKLKAAGEFNVGTKLYGNGKKARKARGE
ncbi:hypothetical protein [Xanthomonas virus PB119]|nr:hypothetical protein [Xanthomonas virus PB119]